MFVKLALFACFVAVGLAQHQPKWNGPLAGGLPASLYPAGVSPQACPNFPNCANPAVAANPGAPLNHGYAQQGNQWNGGQQQWNQGQQWNGNQGQQWNGNQGQDAWNNHANPLDRGEYVGDGDYKGEGLAESGAYGVHHSWNQNQNNAAPQWNGGQNWNAAPQYAGQAAQVPAGVDAHSCPNYPFCH